MAWKIELDEGTCIGSGMCAGTAPDHFDLEAGYGCPKQAEIEPAEAVMDAAESCPVEAITIRDAETGQVLAPTD